jgi:hypothetical protein
MPSTLKLAILAGAAAGMAFALPSTPARELSAESKPPNGVSTSVINRSEYSLSENTNSYAWSLRTL